ncbi:MAG: 50S ribosomal protein L15 [Candidatus Magasanikbacteria bacterium RIFCSPHIGHO2_02_FULL_41_13]|uniref:Large ribosomal subunit protein uL15 n=1 Tax=Candidatus Magasanikbacteria bacterium RIFCSPHIGHO2_02_FULL_41_13 TaxID=1798676 RepID=A0A1F6M4I2_9BACT|nr:MAG: 50S ribosomal protein L15 [Candidatus Magasanikbacteria bacterium RIFCSPHIGHO2_02_FULL_41_13]
MSLQAHLVQPSVGSNKKSKRVGRGNSSQKGTTAGRGTKGQKARSGGRGGNARRSFKHALQKVPKRRGLGFPASIEKPQALTLATLERVFTAGAKVSPQILEDRGLIRTAKNGVKIVASGKLTKALNLEGCLASKSVIASIEQNGGTLKF